MPQYKVIYFYYLVYNYIWQNGLITKTEKLQTKIYTSVKKQE